MKNKTPHTNAKKNKLKKLWDYLVAVFLRIIWLVSLVILGIVKAFNFCLTIILILCGSIKVVTKADDD